MKKKLHLKKTKQRKPPKAAQPAPAKPTRAPSWDDGRRVAIAAAALLTGGRR